MQTPTVGYLPAWPGCHSQMTYLSRESPADGLFGIVRHADRRPDLMT